MSIINCKKCANQGITNRCYITGYNTKCEHNNGWAYIENQNGKQIMNCNSCPKNNLYITGYDIKCGHDNGWAYSRNASCSSCKKELKGYWSMESNFNNKKYETCSNGRYLGITNGYFWNNKSDWIYSYCKKCWINQIKYSIEDIGINKNDELIINELNDLKTMIKEKDIVIFKLNTEIKELKSKLCDMDIYCITTSSEIKQLITSISDLQNEKDLKEDELKQFNCRIVEKEKYYYVLQEQIDKLNSIIKDKETENLLLTNQFKLKEEDIHNMNIKINYLEEKIEKYKLNTVDDIIKEMYNSFGYEDLIFSLQNLEIDDINNLIKSLGYENKKEYIKNEYLNIIKQFMTELLKEVSAKLENVKDNLDFKIKQNELNVEKLKKEFRVADVPQMIIIESINPVEKYINELKKNLEEINIIQNKIKSIM